MAGEAALSDEEKSLGRWLLTVWRPHVLKSARSTMCTRMHCPPAGLHHPQSHTLLMHSHALTSTYHTTHTVYTLMPSCHLLMLSHMVYPYTHMLSHTIITFSPLTHAFTHPHTTLHTHILPTHSHPHMPHTHVLTTVTHAFTFGHITHTAYMLTHYIHCLTHTHTFLTLSMLMPMPCPRAPPQVAVAEEEQ